jgi:hypothetical protein
VKSMVSHWYNERHSISNFGMVGKFMQLPTKVIMQLWENIFFALSAPYIKENTHLARCAQISKTHNSVHYIAITYCRPIIISFLVQNPGFTHWTVDF